MNTNLNGVYIADAYFRLSREDGDKAESDSIVNQRALVREFLKTHPEIQIYQERVDDGFSGVSFNRPGVQKFPGIIPKRISRSGRYKNEKQISAQRKR